MQEKIKLIWDFRGQDAAKIASHHERHLKEYVASESLSPGITGMQIINELYSLAFLVVTREDMVGVRDALKPHRGEAYQ